MFKMIAAMLLVGILCPGQPGISLSDSNSCPQPSNLQVVDKTGTTISLTWDGALSTTDYRVWWELDSCSCASSPATTGNPCFTFGNLATGNYIFYVAAACGSGTSDWIGIQETIVN